MVVKWLNLEFRRKIQARYKYELPLYVYYLKLDAITQSPDHLFLTLAEH